MVTVKFILRGPCNGSTRIRHRGWEEPDWSELQSSPGMSNPPPPPPKQNRLPILNDFATGVPEAVVDARVVTEGGVELPDDFQDEVNFEKHFHDVHPQKPAPPPTTTTTQNPPHTTRASSTSITTTTDCRRHWRAGGLHTMN